MSAFADAPRAGSAEAKAYFGMITVVTDVMHPVQAAPRQSTDKIAVYFPREMHPVQAAPRQSVVMWRSEMSR